MPTAHRNSSFVLILSSAALLLAGCETYDSYDYRPPVYSPPPPPPPVSTYAEQRIAALERENADQRQKILLLAQDIAKMRGMVCVLVVRLEKVRVITDPANGKNHVIADPGPVRQASEYCGP